MLLSVVIITLNEQENIGRCIRSVRAIADEVIIVDSYSTDDTASIAAKLGATVIMHPFQDYVDQKNYATGQATYDWILSLDADEVLSPELLLNIRLIKTRAEHSAYQLKRLTDYCGRWIRHCGWYPDKKVRLFDRTKGKWRGNKIHEQWKPYNSGAAIGELQGDLYHYSFNSVAAHLRKVEKYTDIMAGIKAEKGNMINPLKIWVCPFFNFLQSYVFKAGFLDGNEGYMVCRISAYANHLKYKKARAILQRSRTPLKDFTLQAGVHKEELRITHFSAS